MGKVVLAIIFNHKYLNNIPRLYDLYHSRFSNIFFIVPFLTECEADEKYNIIGVYESSYSFQGYISQAYFRLKNIECDHIIFGGDDLIINPNINEDNYMEYFNLDEDSSFNVEICKINERFDKYIWDYKRISTNLNYLNGNRFVNTNGEILDAKKANQVVINKGYEGFELFGSQYYRSVGPQTKIRCLFHTILNRKKILYPAFGGYSDLTVISSKDIHEFVHYCGVFAALGVFVEIAIPTAMIFSCRKIRTIKDTDFQRGDIWGMKEKE